MQIRERTSMSKRILYCMYFAVVKVVIQSFRAINTHRILSHIIIHSNMYHVEISTYVYLYLCFIYYINICIIYWRFLRIY